MDKNKMGKDGAEERLTERDVIVARVDEVQIPRKAPVMTPEIEAKFATNPSLARAWARMMKNYDEHPYQIEPNKDSGQAIKRSLDILGRWMDEQSLTDLPAVDTSWIFGAPLPSAPNYIPMADVVESPVLAAPAKAASDQGEAPGGMFAAVEVFPRSVRIELAWLLQTDRGDKMKEATIDLDLDDPYLTVQLAKFRSLAEGKSVYLWTARSLFEAITPYLTPDFEPLHLWLAAEQLHPLYCYFFSIPNEQRHLVTVETLSKRTGAFAQMGRKAPRACQLLRIHQAVRLYMVKKSKGSEVAPLVLDEES